MITFIPFYKHYLFPHITPPLCCALSVSRLWMAGGQEARHAGYPRHYSARIQRPVFSLANLKWRWMLASMLAPKFAWGSVKSSQSGKFSTTTRWTFHTSRSVASPTFESEVGGRVEDKDLIQLWHFSWGDALDFGIGEKLTSGNPRSPATTESNADWALRTSMWVQILERASAQPCCAPSWLSNWCDYKYKVN